MGAEVCPAHRSISRARRLGDNSKAQSQTLQVPDAFRIYIPPWSSDTSAALGGARSSGRNSRVFHWIKLSFQPECANAGKKVPKKYCDDPIFRFRYKSFRA